MTQRSIFPRLALLAGLALVVFHAGEAMAQSVTTGPSSTYIPTYTPPPVVTKQPETPRSVGIPTRNMPDRLQEMRVPVNPAAATTSNAQPRRAVLNRLENRLTTGPAPTVENARAKTQNAGPAARQLLESAQPIL